ncbi:exonuclease RecJ [Halorubrum sp. JWXQ-INN 858]|uniref:exonuclease RecJ n=1 Tax=Halorubrum sp. JWXQ-INN 858 TaxID=2690782 RepID=UPI0013F8277A|nr:exonuclease RecJ [Halorubrum sp. JWXQ-INN 858]MWV65554.1 exonuclease RecJ [Halorubrum sp. JWXQ-INN 858]
MTETTAAAPAPDALASVLADAPFVRLVATDDGDALAAAGTLARALRQRAIPFQVRVSRDPVPDATDDDVVVTVGSAAGPHAIPATGRPASTTAFAVAAALGVAPDPVLPLAGVVAAGSVPGTDGSGDALEAAERAGLVDRRPGVAVPTADLADGLAASTLIRAPYSGDPESTRAALADLGLPATLDDDAHRRLASLVAVDVVAAESASERAASAVERALRPYATDGDAAPFATVGGYADVLDALALESPGTGVALALAADPDPPARTAALDVWRTHGHETHRALDAATIGRYDGCVVARVEASATTLPTAARLIRDFRSPEPVAIALEEASGAIAAAAIDGVGGTGLGDACRAAATAVGGDGWGNATRGGLVTDGDPTEALAALREELPR